MSTLKSKSSDKDEDERFSLLLEENVEIEVLFKFEENAFFKCFFFLYLKIYLHLLNLKIGNYFLHYLM